MANGDPQNGGNVVGGAITDRDRKICFINGYAIDITTAEEYGYENETTPYPVESGVEITDHVIRKPRTVKITGLVSSSPIGPVAVIRSVDDDDNPIEFAQAVLQDAASGRLCTVETGRGIRRNMIVTSLSEPVTPEDGDCYAFEVTFEQATFVDNDRTLVRVAVPIAAAAVNKGKKKVNPYAGNDLFWHHPQNDPEAPGLIEPIGHVPADLSDPKHPKDAYYIHSPGQGGDRLTESEMAQWTHDEQQAAIANDRKAEQDERAQQVQRAPSGPWTDAQGHEHIPVPGGPEWVDGNGTPITNNPATGQPLPSDQNPADGSYSKDPNAWWDEAAGPGGVLNTRD